MSHDVHRGLPQCSFAVMWLMSIWPKLKSSSSFGLKVALTCPKRCSNWLLIYSEFEMWNWYIVLLIIKKKELNSLAKEEFLIASTISENDSMKEIVLEGGES